MRAGAQLATAPLRAAGGEAARRNGYARPANTLARRPRFQKSKSWRTPYEASMLRAQIAERAGVTRAGRGPRASGAAGLRLPAHVAPMLATASDRIPVDSSGWNFEWKWDGVRALAFI